MDQGTQRRAVAGAVLKRSFIDHDLGGATLRRLQCGRHRDPVTGPSGFEQGHVLDPHDHAVEGVRVDLGDGGKCLLDALVEVLDPAQGAQRHGFAIAGIR